MKKYIKLISILIAALFAAWVAWRVCSIASESKREVFNAARITEQIGIQVKTITALHEKNILIEPLHVKNGKAFVSLARAKKFKIGQKISSGGFIISVSRDIDLDTGLHAVRTSSPDGDSFVLIEHSGVLLPLHAIKDGKVFIIENGAAKSKEIKIIAQDAENAIVSGLDDGDKIILSRVEENQKIKS